jgi:isoquinoline 1-oxidoreductase subunit beta
MSTIENVSRRRFLAGGVIATGALVLGVRYCPKLSAGYKPPHDTNADRAILHPSVYLGINPDGTVWIVAHRSEMGTTSRTTLPLVVADELDADWKRVKIEQAIGDKRYGDQNTDGSHSIRSYYDAMREAGATARFMLIQAAAREWGVPAAECETDLHVVVHRSTNRRAGYGDLASAAAKLPVPKREDLKFKAKSAWRYIGKGEVSYDLEGLVTGKAIYGMDSRANGMVYASVERPPVLGGKVKSYDDKEALKVAGVRQIVPIDPFHAAPAFQPLWGIAVIADNTWAAFQGRKKLNISWDNGANETYNSDQYKNELRETSHGPCKVVRNIGDANAVFAKGGEKVDEADFYVPLLAHASMEPLVALAEFKDGKATLWAPSQNPQAAQDIVSKVLGIAKEDVVCQVTLLGGGFGRKSKPDYVAEAAVLSKKNGPSGESGLDARGRHQVRLLQPGGVYVYEGGPGWSWLCGWKEYERSGSSRANSPEVARRGTRSSHFQWQGRNASLQEFAQRRSDSRPGDAHSFAASKEIVWTPCAAAFRQVAMWLDSFRHRE